MGPLNVTTKLTSARVPVSVPAVGFPAVGERVIVNVPGYSVRNAAVIQYQASSIQRYVAECKRQSVKLSRLSKRQNRPEMATLVG
jgi:hypothetical protein